ncbi:hypothetical protein [Streptomyces sp. NPDC052114]|uniref:hypothetical protein n=1 Tax=unclassified Streptomyces TaxID=2593676 RepID=UPI00343E4504
MGEPSQWAHRGRLDGPICLTVLISTSWLPLDRSGLPAAYVFSQHAEKQSRLAAARKRYPVLPANCLARRFGELRERLADASSAHQTVSAKARFSR